MSAGVSDEASIPRGSSEWNEELICPNRWSLFLLIISIKLNYLWGFLFSLFFTCVSGCIHFGRQFPSYNTGRGMLLMIVVICFSPSGHKILPLLLLTKLDLLLTGPTQKICVCVGLHIQYKCVPSACEHTWPWIWSAVWDLVFTRPQEQWEWREEGQADHLGPSQTQLAPGGQWGEPGTTRSLLINARASVGDREDGGSVPCLGLLLPQRWRGFNAGPNVALFGGVCCDTADNRRVVNSILRWPSIPDRGRFKLRVFSHRVQ